jgi:hypothetical protein
MPSSVTLVREPGETKAEEDAGDANDGADANDCRAAKKAGRR